MQALILAAGMGRRLGELTRNSPKCLVRLNGVSLLERMLAQLASQGCQRVVLVIGYHGEKVRDLVGSAYHGMDLVYVENPIYESTNNIYSLYLAREYLLREDTILLESDIVLDDSILQTVCRHPYQNLAVVAKYQSWMDGTVLTLDGQDNIVGFTAKQHLDYDRLGQYFKTVNLYRFSRQFSVTHYVPFLEAYCQAVGNNEYYEQVLRIITLLERPNIKALRLGEEKWYEIDTAQDLADAETLFASPEEELTAYAERFGGFWRFPFLLDFHYLVNPFFPPERLKREMRSQFETLLGSYPSGQRVNALLAAGQYGLRPDQVVAGNGAAELIKALMESGTARVGIVQPTFDEYANRLPPERCRVFMPADPDFKYRIGELLAFVDGNQVDDLVLVNPNNPTGQFLLPEDVLELSTELAKRRKRLLLDESFVDFATAVPSPSVLCADTLDQHTNLVILRSLSKSHGVPGLRLGLAASGRVETIEALRREVAIWNVNAFAEFFLQIMGKYQSEYRQACQLLAVERDRFGVALMATGRLRVLPSQANYFLCEVLPPEAPATLARRVLATHRILIRDCSDKPGFSGRPFVRIAVRSQAENQLLVDALTTG